MFLSLLACSPVCSGVVLVPVCHLADTYSWSPVGSSRWHLVWSPVGSACGFPAWSTVDRLLLTHLQTSQTSQTASWWWPARSSGRGSSHKPLLCLVLSFSFWLPSPPPTGVVLPSPVPSGAITQGLVLFFSPGPGCLLHLSLAPGPFTWGLLPCPLPCPRALYLRSPAPCQLVPVLLFRNCDNEFIK